MSENKNFNTTVLMSGAEYFNSVQAINALMTDPNPVDVEAAVQEHALIKQSLESVGVTVKQTPAPPYCQDGVYTANWAIVHDGRALMSRLPNTRQPEEAYARQALQDLGLKISELPEPIARFSGQGDALACGDIVFTQSPYRTVAAAHTYLEDYLGFQHIVALETHPARRYGSFGPAVINSVTGLPDSPTYDIDLALAVLKQPDAETGEKGLIAYCPAVFKHASRRLLRELDLVDKIEVSREEALGAFALNLVSTGEAVVMNSGAPEFARDIKEHGIDVITLDLPELRKGGGSIRCTTLTLDN